MNFNWVTPQILLINNGFQGKFVCNENWININNNPNTLNISPNVIYNIDCSYLNSIADYKITDCNINECINSAFDTFIKRYNFFDTTATKTTDLKIVNFDKGNFYKEHVEIHDTSLCDYDIKYLVCFICFKNNNRGVDLKYGDIIINMLAGDIVIFDCSPLTPYRIDKITSGNSIFGISWLV